MRNSYEEGEINIHAMDTRSNQHFGCINETKHCNIQESEQFSFRRKYFFFNSGRNKTSKIHVTSLLIILICFTLLSRIFSFMLRNRLCFHLPDLSNANICRIKSNAIMKGAIFQLQHSFFCTN